MKRANKFSLRPTKEQEEKLPVLCEMSTVLWNKPKELEKTIERSNSSLDVLLTL